MSDRVELDIDGDTTTLDLGGVQVEVPTSLVSVSGGRVMVEVPQRVALSIPAGQVAVIAHHPEPTIEQIGQVIAGLNADQVTALMAQESAWSSMDDPMGLVAMRAVARAVRGEIPEQDPGDLGGL